MTLPLRRKRRTTARGRSTPIRMLASAFGLGLFLVGGTASAQNWVPSTSPYGTWRQPAPASKPAANSWREVPKTNLDSASKDSTDPLPPPAPNVQQPDGPTRPVAKPIPSTPPIDLTPAQTVIKSTDTPPVPSPTVIKASEPLPPLPPSPGPPPSKQASHEVVNSAPQSALPEKTEYTIRPAAFQPQIGTLDDRRASEERTLDQTIQLEPPGMERVFRLESEASMQERMRQEGKSKLQVEKVAFPDETVVSREPYPGRHWPPQIEEVEPNYVCHGRLLFEDKNTERFGWDFGIVQPIVSTAKFYADIVTLPYHVATAPCRQHECSAGLCLPGDPVPYLIYPPEISVTGSLAEAASVLGILAVFP
jgi:hypothetical protein